MGTTSRNDDRNWKPCMTALKSDISSPSIIKDQNGKRLSGLKYVRCLEGLGLTWPNPETDRACN